jgi:glycosyltransferase involved in cell wall biosynthesis
MLPPMDLLVGKGTYIFPNFRNWPLLYSKSITYIHDVSFNVFPEYVEKKNLRFLARNVHTWMKRTNIVVTVSNHAKNEITRFYPQIKDNVRVVYNGITEAFKPIHKSEVEPVLKEYNLKFKEYFIFLSNLEPRKNVNGLLEAYEKFMLESGHQDTKLVLVGGMGWNNEAILQKIASINRRQVNVIVPSHYVPDADLPALLSGAAALIHPAHYEGFGISPLQAMACGTQVVVANNSSLPEVVADGGVYVDDRSVEDILRGINVVYNKRYVNNAKGLKQSLNFSWKQSADNLIDILLELESKK